MINYKFFLYFLVYLFGLANPSYSSDLSLKIRLPERPSNIPGGYVPTPVGYAHPDCIMTIEEGDSVKESGMVTKKDGSILNSQACKFEIYNKSGMKLGSNDYEQDLSARTPYGWEAAVTHTLNKDNNITKIVGEWTVPNNPYDYKKQTLFLFNSIQTASTIIQPVLGFNQFGAAGPQWSIASWMVSHGQIKKTNNVTVHPGDTIRGTMMRELPTGSDPREHKKWRIVISVIKNGTETTPQTLDVELSDSEYSSFEEAAYETYDAEYCAQITLQQNYKPMNFKFTTKQLKSKTIIAGYGEARSLIGDSLCGVKTHIDKGWTSEIHY